MKHNLIKFVLSALVICLFLTFNQAIKAQSALDGFDPNADGRVRAIVVQPDGKILIGGDFTTILGTARIGIVRLHADGSLDIAFNPNANGTVNAIAVQPDGKVLVGGSFTGIGGQPRNNIARLDATSGAADAFNPNANGVVNAIAIQSDGKILVGGAFNGANSIGGQTRNHIARLNAATGAADAFDPNASGIVNVITVQSDGKILAGGVFTGIGGQTRNRIARLDAATGAADAFNPNASGDVFSIAVQADAKILIGGAFTLIGGQPRSRLARLDAADGSADAFNPNANSSVRSIAIQSDGKILVGGVFNGANSIGGQTRNHIARLDAASGAVDAFNPSPDLAVYAIAVQSDGKILVGGDFATVGGVTRDYIARVERDGRLDRTLQNLSTVGSSVLATAIQPDGKILIGGNFTTILGTARSNIARLNTDGTLDTTFNPNATSIVNAIAVQPDGKVLVGGQFIMIGGQSRSGIARLDQTTGAADSFNPNVSGVVYSIAVQSDGKILVGGAFPTIGDQLRNSVARLDATSGAADSWNPNANSAVYSIAVQSDGKVLVGGAFTSIGAAASVAPRNRIARLDATTGAVESWNPNASGVVNSIAVQSDGKILAGGAFFSIGGQARNRIARLDATSGAADTFNPNADGNVFAIAVQSDGRVLAGGAFTGIGGQTRNRIARLDATSGAADAFNPNANGVVNAIAIQSDGKILAGGQFTSIGTATRNYFARLSNDTAARSTLSVTKTSVTLTRNGSAAQFTRVVFEQSIDGGATYTALGTATNSFAAPAGDDEAALLLAAAAPQASGYTLTGLNLPSNQNILIRARGFYRTGFQNGSETIEDKVQNAFLMAATAATVSMSGRVMVSKGRGLINARVYLTEQNGETRLATTSAFGYYRFDDMQAGQTVIVTIVSKRYRFAAQVVNVTEDIGDLNFYAEP